MKLNKRIDDKYNNNNQSTNKKNKHIYINKQENEAKNKTKKEEEEEEENNNNETRSEIFKKGFPPANCMQMRTARKALISQLSHSLAELLGNGLRARDGLWLDRHCVTAAKNPNSGKTISFLANYDSHRTRPRV